ncbi:hypothetical protein LIER_15531 [Lithospermum erythrorhizon]|uniref:Uncharacterized protein n=1 Tax=Lithospermum erythrorhizon TaxID=34254 RepID=A0AAV3Q575_LITER
MNGWSSTTPSISRGCHLPFGKCMSRGFLKEASEFPFGCYFLPVASGSGVSVMRGLTSAEKESLPLYLESDSFSRKGVFLSGDGWFLDGYPKRLTLLSLISFPQKSSILGKFCNFADARHLLCQGITSACDAIRATKEGLTKTKKKRSLVKGVTLPADSGTTFKDKPATSESGDKQVGILLAANDTFLPNAVLLRKMQGKRPIAFKKVKVVKKATSSPRPIAPADLPPRSSPSAAEPSPSSLSPPGADFPQEQPSSSLVGKRPSDDSALQRKEKRAHVASELSDPPKGGIPPPLFPS